MAAQTRVVLPQSTWHSSRISFTFSRSGLISFRLLRHSDVVSVTESFPRLLAFEDDLVGEAHRASSSAPPRDRATTRTRPKTKGRGRLLGRFVRATALSHEKNIFSGLARLSAVASTLGVSAAAFVAGVDAVGAKAPPARRSVWRTARSVAASQIWHRNARRRLARRWS